MSNAGKGVGGLTVERLSRTQDTGRKIRSVGRVGEELRLHAKSGVRAERSAFAVHISKVVAAVDLQSRQIGRTGDGNAA